MIAATAVGRAAGAASEAVSLASRYRRVIRRRLLILAAIALLLAICVLADLTVGASGLSVMDLLSSLGSDDERARAATVILFDIRLPMALLALVVGAALAIAGAEMQTVLNNPLASPFTLGLSNAACFGAALAIAFDLSLPGVGATVTVPLCAFAAALVAVAAIDRLGRRFGGGAETIVLFGIAMVFAMNALLWLVQFLATADALQQIVFWTMGSLQRASWDKLAAVAVVLALYLPFAMNRAWALTALRGGEDQARGLGIDTARLRLHVLLGAGLLAAVAVSFVGAIGFIGLVAPHITRMLLGEDHRFLLPGSALIGGLLLSAASLLSKSAVSGLILPVGIVTALVGIPIFLVLILAQRGHS